MNRNVLVLKKTFICLKCNNEFSDFIETTDDGFSHSSKLYLCRSCNSIYSYSIEEESYFGKIEEYIKDVHCNRCNHKLSITLLRYKVKCPKCGNEKIKSISEKENYYLDTFSIVH